MANKVNIDVVSCKTAGEACTILSRYRYSTIVIITECPTGRWTVDVKLARPEKKDAQRQHPQGNDALQKARELLEGGDSTRRDTERRHRNAMKRDQRKVWQAEHRKKSYARYNGRK